MASRRKSHEFNMVADAMLSEIEDLSTKAADSLFATPAPDSKRMVTKDYVALTQRMWDWNPDVGADGTVVPPGTPNSQKWRALLLERMAPAGPDGGRPEWGMRAFNSLLASAFPDGRPPDPPPPPPPIPFAVHPGADEAAGAPPAAPGQPVMRDIGAQVADAHQDQTPDGEPSAGPPGGPQGMIPPAGGPSAGPPPAAPPGPPPPPSPGAP